MFVIWIKNKLTMKQKVVLNERQICDEYQDNKKGIEFLCKKYHVGKLRIKEILKKNNIEIKKRGKQGLVKKYVVSDYKQRKYVNDEKYCYIVKDLTTEFVSKDIDNKAGALTSYIAKQYGVKIPNLYERRIYYMRTGNYWWETFLTYERVKNKPVKKCPYCNWETVDIGNKSGMFETHLLKKHNITKLEHLEKYPEDYSYFIGKNDGVNLQMEKDTSNFVVCQVCGKKLRKISNAHLRLHGITKNDYMLKYGTSGIMSERSYEKYKVLAKKMNLSLGEHPNERFTSKGETEIISFLNKNGIECGKNRSILQGQELDIYIPSKKFAIEYNGDVWHTENFGKKDKNYHLRKLNACNAQGINLIQIFDDEYINHKELVLNKISHILKIDSNKPKIYGRKCIVKKIYKYEAEDFLNQYHIQGFSSASLYLGAFYGEKLIGVMTFKKNGLYNKGWELTRFATDYNYVCCGVGGKIFQNFVKSYDPVSVFSFADRRWTVSVENNIYTKLGFEVVKILKPDFRYFKMGAGTNERIHKLLLSKRKLLKLNNNFDERMTEREMTQKLGYDRIWDCGLIKYIWYAEKR